MTLSAPPAPQALATRLGQAITARAARPDDAPLLAELVYGVSARSRWLRYFQPLPPSLSFAQAEGRRMASPPAGRAITLIATAPDGAARAVAELASDPAGRHGEGAILVRDDYQGQGIGTALGRLLLALAQAGGLAELRAYLLPDNHAARRLFRRLGAPAVSVFEGGLIQVTLRLPAAPPHAAPAHGPTRGQFIYGGFEPSDV